MKKSLRPQQAAPVQRQTTATTTTSNGVGVGALTYCDIATRECTPFAGDDAE